MKLESFGGSIDGSFWPPVHKKTLRRFEEEGEQGAVFSVNYLEASRGHLSNCYSSLNFFLPTNTLLSLVDLFYLL